MITFASMKRGLYILLVAVVALTSCSRKAEVKDQAVANAIAKGKYYFANGQLASSLECFTKGLKEAQIHGNPYLYNVCQGNLGNIYMQMGDIDRAIHYYQKAYQAACAQNDERMQFNMVSNMLGAYSIKGDAVHARRMFRLLTNLKGVVPTTQRHFIMLQSKGLIASAEKNYAQAVDFMEKAVRYAAEAQLDDYYEIEERSAIAEVYLRWKKPDSAIVNFKRCQSMAVEKGFSIVLADIYKGIAQAYEQKCDTARQQEWHTRYLLLTDTLMGRNQIKDAENIIFNTENRYNEQAIESLTTRNQAQTVIICLVVMLAVLLTVLIVMMVRSKKRMNAAQQLLVEKNERLRKESQQQERLLNQYAEAVAEKQTDSTMKKNNSIISKEQTTLLLRKIGNVMSDVSMISNSDFSLKQLADTVGSNTKYVSFAINEAYGMNFKSVLNEYRIREACRRLTSPEYDKYTLMGIGRNLGFNSSSTFIAAFKKVTGMTPSVYQRLALNQKTDKTTS